MPRQARSAFAIGAGGWQFWRSAGHSGSSLDLGLGSVPRAEVAFAGLKAGRGRRLEFLPIQRATAAGTARDVDVQQDTHPIGGRVGLVVPRGRSRAEQLAALSQLLPLHAIGQQAVMPNAREVLWKHVLQETVEEFLGRQDVRLQTVAIAAIAVV